MTWRSIDLSAQKTTDPEGWKKKVLSALKKADTNEEAAEALEISLSTLNRYIRAMRKAGSPVPRRSRALPGKGAKKSSSKAA